MFTIVVVQVVLALIQSDFSALHNLISGELKFRFNYINLPSHRKRYPRNDFDFCVRNIVNAPTKVDDATIAPIDSVVVVHSEIDSQVVAFFHSCSK